MSCLSATLTNAVFAYLCICVFVFVYLQVKHPGTLCWICNAMHCAGFAMLKCFAENTRFDNDAAERLQFIKPHQYFEVELQVDCYFEGEAEDDAP